MAFRGRVALRGGVDQLTAYFRYDNFFKIPSVMHECLQERLLHLPQKEFSQYLYRRPSYYRGNAIFRSARAPEPNGPVFRGSLAFGEKFRQHPPDQTS